MRAREFLHNLIQSDKGLRLAPCEFLLARQTMARLAQSAERKALNFVVVGSSPTVGVLRFIVAAPRRACAS